VQYNVSVQYCGSSYYLTTSCLVLTIFNLGVYLAFKSIFHKALNLF